jgi:hypothetical protein
MKNDLTTGTWQDDISCPINKSCFVLLMLKSKQGDVIAAFLHALLGPNEHIYCEMPLGFRIPGKVLKLKKTLYGLRQSPCAFLEVSC